MVQEQFEGNNDRQIESVYSTRIRAGKRRTYFFDVRATRANDYFLTITESRKRFDNNGYDRHKVFIYKEDFNKFIKAVTEAMDFVKTELMPNFDFDAFNHEEDGANGQEERPRFTAPPVAQIEKDTVGEILQAMEQPKEELSDENEHIVITEKVPLEAKDTPASQGDNLSGEEVDKW